eukprot:TRINITY_DN8568_c0_g1_i1.p1 TRINITY_DN8568_c0_g1~~TRINITY_DN8568_c0_g1_i1.p1  ORF type:complete len:109 (+),score=21.14 TRINITY_DN8568_c0_g1_i1:70-396(+)
MSDSPTSAATKTKPEASTGSYSCNRLIGAHVKSINKSTSATLGEHKPVWTTDYRSNLREYTSAEQADVRGAMAEEVRADLRACHFSFGRDKTSYQTDSMKQAQDHWPH